MENESEDRYTYGECRCCLERGHHREILEEYYFNGVREVYYDMFSETFNLLLSRSTLLPTLLCARCVTRLRDARALRAQAQDSERLLAGRDQQMLFVDVPNEPSILDIKPEISVKVEAEGEIEEYSFIEADDLAQDLQGNGVYKKHEEKSEPSDSDSDSELVRGEAALLARFSTVPRLPTRADLPHGFTRQLDMLAHKIVPANSIDISTPPESEKVPFRLHNQKLAQVTNASALLETSNATAFKTKMRSGFPCFYCRNIFSNPKVLREHQVKHPKSQLNKLLSKYTADALVVYADITDLKCTLCNQSIGSLNELKTHLVDAHDKKLHTDVQERVIPFKLEDRESDYACQECGKRFETFGATERHMNVHYSHYVCEECGAGFVTKRRLKVHAYLIHSKKTDAIHCEPCKKTFESKTKYKIHLDYVHKKLKKNKCNQCSETFIDYFTRQRHMELKHGVKLLIYKCKSCEKSFNRKYSLKLHYNRIHIATKEVQCDLCPFMCFTKSELREHMYKHGDEKGHGCGLCPKTFARKRSLNMHIKRIHS